MIDELKTALYTTHLDLGAKMAPFAGFAMPLQYTSAKDEAVAVRENAGVFDVSHMGEFMCTGPEALKFADYLLTNDITSPSIGKAIYSPLCNQQGKILDDLIVYKLKTDKILFCVNAANIQKDWEWISKQAENFDCKLSNISDEISLLALQGPKSYQILQEIGCLKDIDPEYYSVTTESFADDEIIFARTGYTGEDGFEIFCNHQSVKILWEKLMQKGVTPCGLVARDVLRLEVCYPLYGNELGEELTPYDCGLRWTVKMGKTAFIPKESLSDYQQKYQLVKLILDKGIPRADYEICDENGNKIGLVTSGTHSPMLKKGIALGLVEKILMPENRKFTVKVRQQLINAQFQTKPFYSGGHK